MKKVKIFAHRGNWESFPENSESAICSSINNGFDVEIDIRFTADKKIVLMHDSNFFRLCGEDKNISDFKSDELKNIPFLSKKSEFPMFFDKLAKMITNTQRYFAIHFKQSDQNKENCRIIADLFNKYDLYNNCFLFNLSLESCRIIREIDPKIKLSLLISDFKFEPFVFLFQEVEKYGELFDIFWAAEYKNLYSQDLIEKAHQLNKKIIVVSPELHRGLGHPLAFEGYQECWSDLVAWKVDGLCTDYPKVFFESFRKQLA